MFSRLLAVTFDAHDPGRLARFWSGMIGREGIEDAGGVLLPGNDIQLGLRFAPSSMPRVGTNHVHLHLTSTDLADQQHTVAMALALGAAHLDVGQRPEEEHVVLADPEGNEFCVIEPGNSFLAGCGVLGELACSGSREVGLFWSAAVGWPLVWDQDQETAIQSPSGGTKIAWGGSSEVPKVARNRQRFDLAPVDGGQAAEVDRLVALGATRLGADPYGAVDQEFGGVCRSTTRTAPVADRTDRFRGTLSRTCDRNVGSWRACWLGCHQHGWCHCPCCGVEGVSVSKIRTLDLFAGAGGLTLGFERAGLGFEPVFAVEIDPAAARTFKRNFGCPVHDGPIEDIEHFEDADVIIGGPPCQGFSPLGRDRDDESRAQLNELWQHYFRAVRQVRPLAFVIENVPEFQRSAQFAKLLELMKTDSLLRKYAYAYGVLNAADYGVPQRRRRGIFVAVRDAGEVPWPPLPTHGPAGSGLIPYQTVRDAIGGLPLVPANTEITVDEDGRQDLHIRRSPTQRSLERYRAIPEGGNRFDLARNRPDLLPRCWANKPSGTADVMGRLWWDRPSLTIRTEFYKPEKGRYLHPVADRPITHREAAQLQSFPPEFEFEGTKVQVARQIGNAVPPSLATQIAKFVHGLIADRLAD